MRNFRHRPLAGFCGFFFLSSLALATLSSSTKEQEIPVTARGANLVVYGHIKKITTRKHRNRYGDQLIVSETRFVIEETLKGDASPEIDAVIEGGKFEGIEMRVSDIDPVAEGDKMVVFLDPVDGTYEPHRRGLGLLKMVNKKVVGGQLTLTQIRNLVQRRQ